MEKSNYQFHGYWIKGTEIDYGQEDNEYYLKQPNPLMKKEFVVNEINSSYIYIGILGYAIVYLNGRRISQDELNCDWTNFKKCVYYDVYDVSQFLKIGTNILEVELGNGMYNPAPLKLFGKYNLRNNLAEVGQPRFILDLVNDDKVILTSDSSWILGNGKRLFNNLYLGETVDNNLEANYYAQVQIDDCKRNLVLSEIPKIKRCGDILPQSFINQNDGIIVDFGKMISGFINFACTAHKNQEIVLQYSEAMVDNHLVYSTCLAGSVGERIGEHVIAGGTGAPAIAIQTDRLICKEGYNQFTNKFTYHSFRFVRITGIELTQLQQIYATYVHTDLKKIAKITVDNQELQQLYDAATRTKLNNVHGTFEDCARERLGYGGDMVALATSNLYTFELDKLYKKIIKDFRFEQTAMGGIPETAPYMGIQSNGTAKGEGPILWQLVYPYLVYKHYQYYGDLSLLKQEYPYLKKQLDYLLDYNLNKLVECCLGDHGSILIAGQFRKPTPDKLLLGYCTVLLFLRYNILIYQAIKKDTVFYQQRYQELKILTINKFKNSDGSFGEGSQSGYAFAIELGLDDPKKLCALFVEKVKKDDYVFNSGIFAMALSYEILSKYGYDEVIENWLLRKEAPSYQQMLKSGNQVLAELFVGEHLSLNHAMFASYQQWYYQGLAGIKITDQAVGFDHIVFNPYFSKKVNDFTCQLDTKQGQITSSWHRCGHEINWELVVPVKKVNCQIKINNRYQEIKRISKNNQIIIKLIDSV